jgi:hypothetical protein
VEVRDEGRQRHYRLDGRLLRQIYDWLRTYERSWSERLDRMNVVLEELKERGERWWRAHLGSGMEGGMQESLNRRCGGPPIDPRTRRPVHGLVGRRCERAGRATVAAPGRRPGPRRNSRMTTTTTSTSSSADRTDRVEGVRATCATGSAYLAYPVGARFPRRALAGKSSARVLPRQACSIRACPVGARFPRRTAVELTERIPVSFVGGTASRPPVGARFPRPKRTDDR